MIITNLWMSGLEVKCEALHACAAYAALLKASCSIVVLFVTAVCIKGLVRQRCGALLIKPLLVQIMRFVVGVYQSVCYLFDRETCANTASSYGTSGTYLCILVCAQGRHWRSEPGCPCLVTV